MLCKYCNYPESKVVSTDHDDKRNQIYRRRECIKCGCRYTTQEQVRDKSRLYKTVPPTSVLPK